MTTEYDVVVGVGAGTGAGIIGLAHAYRTHRRGGPARLRADHPG